MAARKTSSKRGATSTTRSRRTAIPAIPPLVSDILIGFVLFLILVVVFRGYIVEGKVDVRPDTINQGEPVSKFINTYIETYGSDPLWFPHVFSGMPLQASGTSHHVQYTYEKLINSLIPKALLKIFHGRMMIHLLLGGISMFLLARMLAVSRLAGFVGAVAFIVNGHVIGTEHMNRIACFMHIPLVFLATYRIFNQPRLFYAVLLGGAFGSQLGSYHPQIAHYTGMMIGLYVLYAAVVHIRDRHHPRQLLVKIGLFGVAMIIAASMAAVLILPMQEYAQYSTRNLSIGASNINVPFATSWSFPPIEILTFIIPSFAGFGGNTYWGAMPFTDFPNYLGVVIVLLAIVGIVYRRNRLTTFLAILSFFALLVSFGRHLQPMSYFMLNFVPFFSKFRAPVMILILLQFACALMAAFGVQSLMDLGREEGKRLTRVLMISTGVILSLVFILSLSGSSFESFMTSIYSDADAAHGGRQAITASENTQSQINAIRFDQLMDDLWMLALLSCGSVGLISLFLNTKISGGLFSAGLAGLVFLDLFLVADRLTDPQYYPGRIDSYYSARQQEPIIQTMQEDSELFRIFPVDDFSTNQYGYFGLSSIGGYHAAKLGIYEELMTQVGLNSFGVLNMLNTKYLISRQPLSGALLSPVIESDQGNLYRNVTALPRAFLVDSLTVITSKNVIFETMKQPTFNPATVAILEEPIETSIGPVDSSEVVLTNYNPHRMDIMVDTSAPALLVLSEVYYPAGWSATIDGEPAKIHKTNYVLRSVVVPAGHHDISFVFEPASFNLGHILSQVSSFLVLLSLIGAGAWRVRKKLAGGNRT